MDLDAAIAAHAQWKDRLAQYLNDPDGSLNPEVIARDDACELGRWLAGDGAALAGRPEYARLVDAHRAFHASAALVVRGAHSGVAVTEVIALGSGSPYAHHSSEVIRSILKLRDFQRHVGPPVTVLGGCMPESEATPS